MSLFTKDDQRHSIRIPAFSGFHHIEQEYGKPASYITSTGEITSVCLRCTSPRCMFFLDDEISCSEFPNFAHERNRNVCPFDAIYWDKNDEMPHIDNARCIKCGLCAARCSVGAIYTTPMGEAISDRADTRDYITVPIQAGISKQNAWLRSCVNNYGHRRIMFENENLIRAIYKTLARCDGRSMIPNLFVRNLLIASGYQCAISRTGDVYTRMDAVYANDRCRGAVEIEFGRDTLDASRRILDDVAVLHSRHNIPKETNSALVVCLSFPNKRQGYYQVIKDIRRVLNIEIQTISIGALLILVWNGVRCDFSKTDFYVDFDNTSILPSIKSLIGRTPHIPLGLLGVFEPEK